MSVHHSQAAPDAGELTGSFVDHLSGRVFPYVVEYRSAANDVRWTARIRLASVWQAVDAHPAARTIARPVADLETEVRDAALTAMCGMDLPAAMASAAAIRRVRLVRQCACAAFFVAILGVGGWFWQTHTFVS